jgi:lysozyme
MYSLSLAGSNDLKNEEGLRLTAYYCPAGKLTVGYGHRLFTAEMQTITKERAEQYFIDDVNRVLTELWFECKTLTQHQVDALVSFIFNIGIGAWRGSTARRDLLNGRFAVVPKEMKRWVHDDHGVVIAGLVIRREKEITEFQEV